MKRNSSSEILIIAAQLILFGTNFLIAADRLSAATLRPGDIVAVDSGAAVYLIDPATGAQTLVSSGGMLVQPFGIALGMGGEIFVSDAGYYLRGIFRIDPETGNQTLLSSGANLRVPAGITVDSTGNLIVADMVTGIIRIDLTTDEQTIVSSGGSLDMCIGVTASSDGNLFAVTLNGNVIRVDPASGSQVVISTNGLLNPESITIDQDGSLLIVDRDTYRWTGRIVRINPDSGVQTVVSAEGELVEPVGIAVNNNGEILVSDASAFNFAGAILQIDSMTGGQTALSEGTGGFVNPMCIGIVAAQVDGGGKPDLLDKCLGTLPNETVSDQGCSINQLVPCAGPWKNHHDYVRAVRGAVREFVFDGLVTKAEKRALVKRAVASSCGRRSSMLVSSRLCAASWFVVECTSWHRRMRNSPLRKA
jgi:streptogramin lyase